MYFIYEVHEDDESIKVSHTDDILKAINMSKVDLDKIMSRIAIVSHMYAL